MNCLNQHLSYLGIPWGNIFSLNTTSVATGLWALRDGINLCLSLNLDTIEIELDAKVLIELLKKDGDYPTGMISSLLIIGKDLRSFLLLKSSIVLGRPTSVLMHLLGGGLFSPKILLFFLNPLWMLLC